MLDFLKVQGGYLFIDKLKNIKNFIKIFNLFISSLKSLANSLNLLLMTYSL